jgi:hypothetical protein
MLKVLYLLPRANSLGLDSLVPESLIFEAFFFPIKVNERCVMKTDINEEKKYFKSFVEDVKQIN